MTSGERLTAKLLRLAPWLAFFLIALPPPLYFLLRYFTSADEPAVWMLITLVSLPIAALAALAVVVALVLYRRRWEKKLRDRLASDGITADELKLFHSELTADERRALTEMQQHNPLLADAYGETLAARLTASRVIASAQRESSVVENLLKQTGTMQGASRATLETELRADRTRLEEMMHKAMEHKAEVETRLRMIEAAASGVTNEAETALALQRLGQMRDYLPVALELTRLELDAPTDIEPSPHSATLPAARRENNAAASQKQE
jgi:hypothetical protein